MVNDPDYREEPLDFERSRLRKCPYCGETLNEEELKTSLTPESNAFICPNCRKRLNVHELGTGI